MQYVRSSNNKDIEFSGVCPECSKSIKHAADAKVWDEYGKVKFFCTHCAAEIELENPEYSKDLSSLENMSTGDVFGSFFGDQAIEELNCIACGAAIRFQIDSDRANQKVECRECSTSMSVRRSGEKVYLGLVDTEVSAGGLEKQEGGAAQQNFQCGHCNHSFTARFEREVRGNERIKITCPKCKSIHRLELVDGELKSVQGVGDETDRSGERVVNDGESASSSASNVDMSFVGLLAIVCLPFIGYTLFCALPFIVGGVPFSVMALSDYMFNVDHWSVGKVVFAIGVGSIIGAIFVGVLTFILEWAIDAEFYQVSLACALVVAGLFATEYNSFGKKGCEAISGNYAFLMPPNIDTSSALDWPYKDIKVNVEDGKGTISYTYIHFSFLAKNREETLSESFNWSSTENTITLLGLDAVGLGESVTGSCSYKEGLVEIPITYSEAAPEWKAHGVKLREI